MFAGRSASRFPKGTRLRRSATLGADQFGSGWWAIVTGVVAAAFAAVATARGASWLWVLWSGLIGGPGFYVAARVLVLPAWNLWQYRQAGHQSDDWAMDVQGTYTGLYFRITPNADAERIGPHERVELVVRKPDGTFQAVTGQHLGATSFAIQGLVGVGGAGTYEARWYRYKAGKPQEITSGCTAGAPLIAWVPVAPCRRLARGLPEGVPNG